MTCAEFKIRSNGLALFILRVEKNGSNQCTLIQLLIQEKSVRAILLMLNIKSRVDGSHLASPQTSFGVRLSRIHFSPTDVC